MSRFWKVLIFSVVLAILLFIFGFPILARESEWRRNIEGGAKQLPRQFVQLQPDKKNAIWHAPARWKRGYKIILDENRNFDAYKDDKFDNNPLPVPLKIGTEFGFAFRHSGYQYRVTDITAKGIEIEIGGKQGPWFYGNRKLFFDWN